MDQHEFLFGKTPYRGDFSPQNLVFNSNLQEFAIRVAYISSLHTAGKLTSEQAYQQVQVLWRELQRSKKGLKISN